MQPATYHHPYVRRPANGSLYDVLDLILDKGIVIDAYVRVSLVGIELVTVDARVVVASVDTYLRFAERADRLVLGEPKKDLSDLLGAGSKAKTAKKTLDAGEKAAKAPLEAGEKAGEKAMEAGEKTMELGKNAAGQVFGNGEHKAEQPTGNGKDEAQQAAETGKGAAEQAAGNGEDATRQAAETGEDATKQAAETGKRATRKTSGAGKYAILSGATDTGLLRRVRSKLADKLADDGKRKDDDGSQG